MVGKGLPVGRAEEVLEDGAAEVSGGGRTEPLTSGPCVSEMSGPELGSTS